MNVEKRTQQEQCMKNARKYRKWNRSRTHIRGADSGMVSVAVAAAILLVLLSALWIIQYTRMVAQDSRLQNIADLAALGAAHDFVRGVGIDESCERGLRVVQANNSTAHYSCSADPLAGTVQIDLKEPGIIEWLIPQVEAYAVAGPADT